jgi:hypothetical protein
MSQKTMPGLLVVVVGLMGLGVVLNLISGGILSAIIGGALVFGVLVGNNGVRQFLRGIAVLQMMFAIWVLAMASGHVSSEVMAIVALFGLGIPVFYFYTLGRDDTRDWMFRKNFHVDDDVNTDIPKL